MSGDTGTAESRLYVARFVRRLLRVVAQLLFRVTVSGDVRQLRHAKTLIVANHGLWRSDGSWLDLTDVQEVYTIVVSLDDL